jgi:hypothetical protein
MARCTRVGWVNDMRGSPRIEGSLEISKSKDGILIAGDPAALRSLAELITWLANLDQESRSGVPKGERCHVHLYSCDLPEFGKALTRFSEDAEICRLDAKGTGDFPEKYREPNKRAVKKARKRGKESR